MTSPQSTENQSHTPGPWRVGEMFHKGRIEILSTDWYVACATGGRPIPEIEANARLIAVAPDMLALLKQMEDWLRPEVEKEPDRSFFWKIVELRRKVVGQKPLFDVQDMMETRR